MSDLSPLTWTGGEVRFDFVRWLDGLLAPCGRGADGAFVRVSVDGGHVTAMDVSHRWLALGYYSGAVRVLDRWTYGIITF